MNTINLLPSITLLRRLKLLPNALNNVPFRIRLGLFTLLIFSQLVVRAQSTANPGTISGKITDKSTGQGVPFASVAVKGKAVGTQADVDGNFQLQLRQPADTLVISALGYQLAKAAVTTSTLNVAIEPAASMLTEVVVRAGENPAFRILRAVHEHRKQNDYSQLRGYEYVAYSQLGISINQLDDRFRQRKPIRAILEALEKKQGGKKAAELPVFLSETISRLYARQHPQRTKEQILKTNINSVGITDDSYVAQFTGAGFNTLNFYKNQVGLFSKEFISPLADGGRSAYTYFLADTTQIGQHTCYGIDFDPKNERDLVFRGKMWIDTLSYALVRIEAKVGKIANINFINQIDIEQTYEVAGQYWLPESTHVSAQVGELVSHTFGAKVDFLTTVRQPLVNQPKDVDFFVTEIELADDRAQSPADYWPAQREQTDLSKQFDQTRALLDTVRNLSIVRTYTKVGQFLLNGGNLPLMRGVDIGSLYSLWARNSVEGNRLRLGLQTNNMFSRNWQLSAYGAYGTRDKIWKTGWEVNFIPNRRPMTLITLRHSYELEQLGLRQEDLVDNSFFRITSRFGKYRQAYYQRETALTAQRDLGPDFTQTVGVRLRNMRSVIPTFSNQVDEPYNPAFSGLNIQSNELFLETRYAPGRLPSRRITNRKIRRRPTEAAPIVTLRYTLGNAETPDKQFGTYHKWQIQLDHALRWGILGRTQYTVRAGYTPSTLPYPLLEAHLGNQTPFYNRNAFNLMNYAEFVSDRYVSVAVEHKFEGLITNRLPIIRRLGWRSFVTGKVLWGSLSDSNRELLVVNDGGAKGTLPVHALRQVPYAEVGYGFENVLKVLRVEAMHRLTYRQNPNVTPFAVKLSFQFSL
ncbi:carboxypeptidase-like regulatory domain-containing protein [Spirosoma sp. BT702]|uniref:Carboxypeptidase-like regulatory domain-containing protein n=1 Tax=Spirosoma profusum TaxID=2771354 RepID=A0A927ANX5_9BACT|nr:DUF5686 and carboxypeptidase-like regulatory domain-containing protein [Spirosoma profusum]MBD2702809.1 carboxypeptidase-like regulatory domain-containing protein [Spirosoma profusum]